ncbi:MAG TPA: hypothetical protein VD813_09325 [Pseudonocardia sp.]|nr:hypothetical protein [Pseudonocardia sp.]
MNAFRTTPVQQAMSRLLHRLPRLAHHAHAAETTRSGDVHLDDRLPSWLRDVAAQGLLAPLADVEVQFGALADPDDLETFGDQWFRIDLTPGQAGYDDVVVERLLSRYTPIGGSSTLIGSTLAVSRDDEDHAVHEYNIESVYDEISDGRDPVSVVGPLFADLAELLDSITDTRPAETM